MQQTVSRRRFVEIAGVTGLLTLAGCADEDEEAPAEEDDPDESEDEPPEDEEEPDDEEEEEPAEEDEEEEAEQTIVVGPDGDRIFDPETLEIDPGTTVEFVWEDDGHNIVVDGQPEDGDWEGVEDLEDSGFTHSHTFEAEGDYEYHCEPHEGAGMEAVVLVGDAE